MSTVIKKPEALNNAADNLTRMMEDRGFGVRELARLSENEPMAVSRLMRGLRMPSADCIYRMAIALNVTVEEIFLKPDKRKSKKRA